jgi:hypothetical protein
LDARAISNLDRVGVRLATDALDAREATANPQAANTIRRTDTSRPRRTSTTSTSTKIANECELRGPPS